MHSFVPVRSHLGYELGPVMFLVFNLNSPKPTFAVEGREEVAISEYIHTVIHYGKCIRF